MDKPWALVSTSAPVTCLVPVSWLLGVSGTYWTKYLDIMSELSGVFFDLVFEHWLDPDGEKTGVELPIGVDKVIMEELELDVEGVGDLFGGVEQQLEAVFSFGFVVVWPWLEEEGTQVETETVAGDSDWIVLVTTEGTGEEDVWVVTAEPVSGVSADTWVELSWETTINGSHRDASGK